MATSTTTTMLTTVTTGFGPIHLKARKQRKASLFGAKGKGVIFPSYLGQKAAVGEVDG